MNAALVVTVTCTPRAQIYLGDMNVNVWLDLLKIIQIVKVCN